MGVYYGNIWRAQDFPFLSTDLFNGSSNATNWIEYETTLILNADLTINKTLVDLYGSPWLTASNVASYVTFNAGFTANLVHMFLWNYADIRSGWSFLARDRLRSLLLPTTWMFWKRSGKRSQEEKDALISDPDIDPHYKLIVANYDECPSSWYFAVFVTSFVCSMVSLYVVKSTVPWWGLIFAMVVLWVYILFFGAQYAITGFQFNLSNVSSTIAGYVFPDAPLGMSGLPRGRIGLTHLQQTCTSMF